MDSEDGKIVQTLMTKMTEILESKQAMTLELAKFKTTVQELTAENARLRDEISQAKSGQTEGSQTG